MREQKEPFSGFPASPLAFTPLPSAFISQVLPQIGDLFELKVTLHLFWLLHQKKGEARFATWDELVADRTLMVSLGAANGAAAEVLAEALEKAVARGTVLNVVVDREPGTERLYLINTAEGRKAVAQLRQGALALPARGRPRPEAMVATRSPLAALYERQIGLLTPAVAGALARAEREHGSAAVAEAIAEAVRYEKRHWSYVSKVLENRRRKEGGAPEDGEED